MEHVTTEPEEVAVFEAEPYCDETVVLRIGKTHDFRTAQAFRRFCEEQIEAGMRNFVLDFSATKILDSTGLRAIFKLHQRAIGEVVFAAPTRPVQTVMQLTGLQRAFRQFATADAACEDLQGRREPSLLPQ